MARARTNGIELEYEDIGAGPPMVLIPGLGSTMLSWPRGLCERIVAAGFRVIRFDNRDSGLSTNFDAAPMPSAFRMWSRWLIGLPFEVPYRVEDMASDVVGLLDTLDIERAHLVGVSMGGMIAQTVAIRYPARVRSLTSFMSHPGDRLSYLGSPRALWSVLTPVPPTTEGRLVKAVRYSGLIAGKRYPNDPATVRAGMLEAIERGIQPKGRTRHLAAMLAAGTRTRELARIAVPTLVLHGSDDPVVLPRAARLTARAVPGATLRIIEGLGHGLPASAWSTVVDAIVAHAAAADR